MTLSSGPNLGLLINGALAEQHYVELMRFWRGLDALIMPSVISRVATLPTTGQVEGDRYISNADSKIYRWTTYLSPAAWESYTPKEGWYIWSVADAKGYRFKSGAWAADTSGGGSGGMANPMTDAGDLIVGGNGGDPVRLPKGAAGKILSSTSNGLAWIDAPTGGGGGTAEKYTTIAPASGVLALADAATTIWGVNLNANAGITLPTGTGVLGLALIFTQDATGSRSVTWPSGITWNGGTPPTLSTAPGSKTLVSLLSVDGGASWLGLPLTVVSGGGSGGSFVGGKLTAALDEADTVAVSFGGGVLAVAAVPANTITLNSGGGSALTGMDSLPAGAKRVLRFNYGGLAVTHDATKFIMPAGLTISSAAGDKAEFLSLGSGNWECLWYSRVDGKALVTNTFTGGTLATGLNEAPTPNTSASGGIVSSAVTNSANTILIQTDNPVTGIYEVAPGAIRRLTFDRATTLTHSASFYLFTAANITARAKDVATFLSLGSSNWQMIDYARADGTPLVGGASGGGDFKKDGTVQMTGPFNQAEYATLPAASTLNIGAVSSDTIRIDVGTGTINAFSGGSPGMRRILYFNGVVTLVNSSNLVLPNGGNDIVTATRDFCEIINLSGGNEWEVVWYQRRSGAALVGSSFTGGNLTTALNEAKMVRVPSMSTTTIGAVTSNVVDLYYDTDQTITSFDNAAAGIRRTITRTGRSASGAIGQDTAPLILKHNADYLVLPGAADITMGIGDSIELISLGGGYWHGLNYQRGNGNAVANTDATAAFGLKQYTLATLPNPAASYYKQVVVTDATGGAKVCMATPSPPQWSILNTTTAVS